MTRCISATARRRAEMLGPSASVVVRVAAEHFAERGSTADALLSLAIFRLLLLRAFRPVLAPRRIFSNRGRRLRGRRGR
jgi:hypothetical protein